MVLKIETNGHVYEDREDGLAACRVCGGAEGSLTTNCPGHSLPSVVGDLVYAGEVDFVDGGWNGNCQAEVLLEIEDHLRDKVEAMGWPRGDFGNRGYRATHAMVTAWDWDGAAENKGAIEFAVLVGGKFYDKDGSEFGTGDCEWRVLCKRPAEPIESLVEESKTVAINFTPPAPEKRLVPTTALVALVDAIKAIAGQGLSLEIAAVAPVASKMVAKTPGRYDPSIDPFTVVQSKDEAVELPMEAGRTHDFVKAGQVWRHYGGHLYTVVTVTNLGGNDIQKWPVTVVYQSLVDMRVWSRSIGEFLQSMTFGEGTVVKR